MTWKITGAPGTGDDLLYSQAGTPTLDLRFASSKRLNDNVSGQNLIDFTRAGTGVGTYVGSDGLIKNSVVNLLLQSEDFSTTWGITGLRSFGSGSIANAATAPDNTLTADKITEDTSTGGHVIIQSIAGLPDNTLCTASCFAKAVERDWVALTIVDKTSALNRVWFNLTTGQQGTTNGSVSAFSAVQYPNGWWRLILTALTATGATTPGVRISIAVADNTPSYTGDGTSGIYLWGAQLEQSSSAGEYVKTTSLLSGAPRFDHDPATGESLGLLVEESRANLLLNSETLSTQNVTVTAVAHTLSFYGTGTVTLSGAHSATVVGTGAYPTRTTLTFTPTAGTLTVTVSGTVQYANLEAGSFATSWIPTAGTTVTRNADVAQITGSNFSRWYSQSQGTMFVDAKSKHIHSGINQFPRVASLSDGTTSNRIDCYFRVLSSYTDASYSVTNAGVSQASFDTNRESNNTKLSTAFSLNNFAFAQAGAILSGATDSSGLVPAVNQLSIGRRSGSDLPLNGTIRRICFFDRRLPNATLQAMTALPS